jgi:hypothetical protein
MRQRIDINQLWRSAREQSMLAYEGAQHQRVANLKEPSPFVLDDLLGDRIDSVGLACLLQ